MKRSVCHPAPAILCDPAISQELLGFALIMDGALLPGVRAMRFVAKSTTKPNVVMPHGDLGGSLTDFRSYCEWLRDVMCLRCQNSPLLRCHLSDLYSSIWYMTL